ncbi:uncharacterized protein LOC118205169 [Stegodyphus dumicola]|uniref:uncharacterized protein LOC118205169 n=1 Tax=Stegodyphus dumicola TaxID=202533 RepID=UPI0015AB3919|nr:uncharacterized protein LOC118205169 [Stegodyphus dumicola]
MCPGAEGFPPDGDRNNRTDESVTTDIDPNNSTANGVISDDDLDKSVKQFFELESFPGDHAKNVSDKTFEKQFCEEHFISTNKRIENGRYIVRLPVTEDKLPTLEASKEIAERRLNLLWKKLYKTFMDEYLSLDHMEKIRDDECSKIEYYIPHHAIFRPESTSTPLRVVFDASSKSSNEVSLNSILLNEGTVQQELFSVVARFRTHRYAFSADIKKMYRQILVDDN